MKMMNINIFFFKILIHNYLKISTALIIIYKILRSSQSYFLKIKILIFINFSKRIHHLKHLKTIS